MDEFLDLFGSRLKDEGKNDNLGIGSLRVRNFRVSRISNSSAIEHSIPI
jgi:hypothetical protein